MTESAPDAWVLRLGPVDAPTAWIRISTEQAAAVRAEFVNAPCGTYWSMTRLSPTEVHVRGGGREVVLERFPSSPWRSPSIGLPYGYGEVPAP